MKSAVRLAVLASVGACGGCGSSLSATLSSTPAAADSVVRIANPACGDPQSGSAFPVAPTLFATAAHVVAGAQSVSVTTRDGIQASATVVLFDPQRDVALLRVSTLALQPLSPTTAQPGDPVAIVGFPAASPRQVLNGTVTAVSRPSVRDIYGGASAPRHVMDIVATVKGGESGGPVLTATGAYAGMLYGYSANVADDAYALTADEMSADIAQARSLVAPVATGSCLPT